MSCRNNVRVCTVTGLCALERLSVRDCTEELHVHVQDNIIAIYVHLLTINSSWFAGHGTLHRERGEVADHLN